jgi:hypothetical protein
MNDTCFRKSFSLFILICGLFITTVTIKAQRPQPLRRGDDDSVQGEERQGRLAAPHGLKCDTNHLTSFTGKILSYERRPDHIFIRIRTDEATTEEFTVAYAQDQDLLKLFRLNGQALGQNGLAKIESRWKRDRRNVRATVWACYDNEWRQATAEMIDWQIGKRKPPETL